LAFAEAIAELHFAYHMIKLQLAFQFRKCSPRGGFPAVFAAGITRCRLRAQYLQLQGREENLQF
jgi:hypothetical protein